MKDGVGMARWNHYLEYVRAQAKSPGRPPREKRFVPGPGITLSRQAGAGAHSVATELVPLLQARAPEDSYPWTVFDRNIVDLVLEEHNMPRHMAKFMPEDRVTEIGDTLDTLFGLHPTTWSLVRKTAETILHLAQLGNVIVIGRGGNIITGDLSYAFHVRLVGSPERRIQHVQDYKHLGRQAATDYVRTEDLARWRYVKKYYGKSIDDPLLYHLVINTDQVGYKDAAQLITEAVYSPGSSIGLALAGRSRI